MAGLHHEGNRQLQDQFDTRRLADRLEHVKVRERFTPDDRELVERPDMFFLATADANETRPACMRAAIPASCASSTIARLPFPTTTGTECTSRWVMVP